MTARVAAVQMTSGLIVQENLDQAAHWIKQAASAGATLVVLPENFALMGQSESAKLQISETLGSGPLQDFLAQQALRHGIYLVGGTIPTATDNLERVYNTCLVYDERGARVACYHKLHLFDAHVQAEVEIYEESKTIKAGNEVVVLETPMGRLGLAICYDIRFPELFRVLANQGAQILAIPAAFTVKTGTAHWEVLMRARAIENFCYVIGAAQVGSHPNGRSTYGHSLLVDPWGTVLQCLPHQPGFVSTEIDLERLQQIRRDFPTDKHQKLQVTW